MTEPLNRLKAQNPISRARFSQTATMNSGFDAGRSPLFVRFRADISLPEVLLFVKVFLFGLLVKLPGPPIDP